MEEATMSKTTWMILYFLLVGYVAFQDQLIRGYERITDQQNETIDRLFQACGAEVTHD